ncbi:dihydrofolate reductase family protein [Sphingobacterium siyangense]|uniref:dihydrofolate reductase family protein n=1 Tax=Sphingobacterium siyangense TaxID=459529 RepID=UPI0028B16F3E|nr:dihydrofolate reductase family protein [Sphingobacterium siyangense]
MRKLIMKMSVSIDGFVAGIHGELDWMFKSGDDHSSAWVLNICESAGVHLMGRKTFEVMASYWPASTNPFAAAMNEIPKAVFTKKGYHPKTEDFAHNAKLPAHSSWMNARVFDAGLIEGIKELKAESGKPLLAHGGAEFMRSLIETGLIDEYHLITHPIALGTGLPIFDGLSRCLDLKLVNVQVFPGGVVAHTYCPA